MSNRALRAAFELPITGAKKCVLVALADHADDSRQCYPSVPRIALFSGITERAVSKCLRELEASGLIRTLQITGQRSRYELTIGSVTPEPSSPPTPERRSPLNDDGPLNHVHPTPERRSPPPLNHVPKPLNHVHPNPHEPPVQPPGNPQHVHVAQDLFAGPPSSKESGADIEAFSQPSSPAVETSVPRPPARQRAFAKPAPVDEAVEIWNRLCESRLPVVSTLNDKRRRDFAARFKDSLGADLANWEAVCRAILANDFLTGGGERGWHADFDWILKPGKITKILESQSRPRADAVNRGGAATRQPRANPLLKAVSNQYFGDQ
jgi:hypothetical protein